ncbi:enoyl-[acyl-carrier-protein] reductase [NADH] 1 [Alphaproteobacteria bacterium]|nr:enoyl-[acyl-carrier-protein] reductase [NADH] 1 [Alphaproteobacteria bacterium]
MKLMDGKRGIVMGVANDRSLAWGIAKTLAEHGAEMVFSYQSEVLYKRVKPLADSLGNVDLIECDVTNDDSVKSLLKTVHEKFGKIDFIVHAIAYSDKEELAGKYVNTSRKNFLNTMDVSCYSFVSVCQHAYEYLSEGASLLTLTYLGAERVMPNYNVMGVAKAALEASIKYLAVDFGDRNIRVNGLSAGPVKTLASAGIGEFRYILKWNQYNAPLKRNTTLDDVGGTGLFLLSNLSSGVTGEVVHADSGYHVVGMKSVDAPDISVV